MYGYSALCKIPQPICTDGNKRNLKQETVSPTVLYWIATIF